VIGLFIGIDLIFYGAALLQRAEITICPRASAIHQCRLITMRPVRSIGNQARSEAFMIFVTGGTGMVGGEIVART
jgi:hypothetical protein